MRPNFLILGAQKSGSSWLSAHLQDHPEVFLYPKEIHYFNAEANFRRGDQWYERHFDSATSAQVIVGEKTPNYMWILDSAVHTRFGTVLPGVHEKIARYMPDGRFVVILRDPVRRAVSAVNHLMRHGQLSPLHSVDDYLVGSRVEQAEQLGVFDMGNYYSALQAYFSVFDREQLLILEFGEDVVKNPVNGLRRVCSFLEISPPSDHSRVGDAVNDGRERSLGTAYIIHRFPSMRRRVGQLESHLPSGLRGHILGPPLSKQTPSPEAVAELSERFSESNRLLFDLLDEEYSNWS